MSPSNLSEVAPNLEISKGHNYLMTVFYILWTQKSWSSVMNLSPQAEGSRPGLRLSRLRCSRKISSQLMTKFCRKQSETSTILPLSFIIRGMKIKKFSIIFKNRLYLKSFHKFKAMQKALSFTQIVSKSHLIRLKDLKRKKA